MDDPNSAAGPKSPLTEPPFVKQNRTDPIYLLDLDGTLIRTDMLLEQLLWLGKHRLPFVLGIIARLLRSAGRARAKEDLAEACLAMPVDMLPYNEQVVELARTWHTSGKQVVLATATHRTIALRIAERLGCFDEVIATTADDNLKGLRKLAAIRTRFGEAPVVYVGDSTADLPILRIADTPIVVGGNRRLLRSLADRNPVRIDVPGTSRKGILRLMRPHHWVKNILVLLPLAMAHRIADLPLLLSGLVAMAAFSLLASAIYCFNDLLDLDADRRHRTKRTRPIASGTVSIPHAMALGLALAGGGLALAAFTGITSVLVTYAVVNVAYSLRLKRTPVLDVFLLALMYVARVIAGGVATGIVLSDWLIGFSLFLFLSLALAKRYAEIIRTGSESSIGGRGYEAIDHGFVMSSGIAVAVGSCVILALYIKSPEVMVNYLSPTWLWPTVPLTLFWLLRLWRIAARGRLDDDPLVFAMKDRVTYIAGLITLLLILLAINVPFRILLGWLH